MGVGRRRPRHRLQPLSVFAEFEGEVFRWAARRDAHWYFTALPVELSADLRDYPLPPRGFGSLRVRARIGATEWTTSIFPDATAGAYVLPLKKAVRDAEGIDDGGVVAVRVTFLDL